MKTKFKQILGRTDDALSNYSFVLLASLLTAICAIIFNHNDSQIYNFNIKSREIIEQKNYILLKFGLSSALGISLLFSLNILAERIGKKLLLNILGIIILVGFYFILPKDKKDFSEIYAYIIAVSLLLSHLLVSFIAFLKKGNEVSFWQFNKNLFINVVLTVIFTAVLTGGIELAILAIDQLFDFNFNKENYLYTFFLLAIFGSTFIFLLFNEDGLKYLEKNGTYPEILKFFTQFVLIPLLLIYVVILYFYMGKIILEWKLPKGWISYLILAYSLIGILALLLVYPLKENHSKSWVKWFSKIFYFTLIPLLGLLFIAIFTRILAYGYTENRYYVLLIAIWLTIVVVYFVFWRKPSIKLIPISLAIFGLFSILFPYFNTFSVSKRSQKTELTEVLNKNNLLENGKINFNKTIQDSIATEIAEKFEFLNKRKETDYLKSFLSEGDLKKLNKNFDEKYTLRADVRNQFKNIVINKTDETIIQDALHIFSNKKIFPVKEYDYLINFEAHKNETVNFDFNDFKIIQSNSNTAESVFKIEFTNNLKSTKTYDLIPFLKKISEENRNEISPINLDEISTEFNLDQYHFKIYFDNVIVQKLNNIEQISINKATVLIRKN